MPTIDERNTRALQSFDRMEPPEPATTKRSGYRDMRECDPRAELCGLLEGIIGAVTFTGDLDAYDLALRATTDRAIATAQRQGWNLGSARMEADSIAADLYSRARGGSMTRTCRDIVISCVAIGVLSPSDLDRPWRIRRLYPSRSDRGCGAWSWCLVCDDRGEMSSGFIGSCRPAAEVALSKRIDLDLNHGQFTLDPLP